MLRALTYTVLIAASGICCGREKQRERFPLHDALTNARADTGKMEAVVADTTVDLFGYYYLAESPPAWSTDIDVLHLSNIDVDFPTGDSTKPEFKGVPLWGSIRLKADSGTRPIDFRLTGVQLQGPEFSFATLDIDSVSYDFSGRFLKFGNFPNNPPNGEIVLVGHLRKLRAGRVLYEADVQFSYFGGD